MKNKKSKRTASVTVAVSALNEENNISNFIKSVLRQKESGFKLDKILVISDGSTDRTARIAKSFKSQILEVRDYPERKGKSSRLNEIYAGLKSDILVQSDADVVFSHPYVIRDIIKPIVENEEVWMCGGHPMPIKARTFTEKAVNCTFEAYDPLRKKWRGGDNVLSADGRLLAYRKGLVKKIYVPENMIVNDMYTYFCCLALGHGYRYVESAVVYFRSPSSIADQIRQNTRFVSAGARMKRYFPRELVDEEKRIPKNILWPAMLKQFVKHPVLSTYIFIVNKYCEVNSAMKERYLNAKWDMAETTKVKIEYAK